VRWPDCIGDDFEAAASCTVIGRPYPLAKAADDGDVVAVAVPGDGFGGGLEGHDVDVERAPRLAIAAAPGYGEPEHADRHAGTGRSELGPAGDLPGQVHGIEVTVGGSWSRTVG
jgi:hypothetical protein